jgi:uncharacterized membrane protein (DUF485 family)
MSGAENPVKLEPHPLVVALKRSKRSHLAMLGIVLLLYLVAIVVLLISWGTHNAGLQMQMASFGMLAILVLLIIHSWIVKGRR